MAVGSSLTDGRHLWLLVPALAWGGILAGALIPYSPIGSIGCVLGSIAIAGVALAKKKKDIVSLCTPIFAIFIFNPMADNPPDILIKLLYAATLTALVIRLEKRFH